MFWKKEITLAMPLDEARVFLDKRFTGKSNAGSRNGYFSQLRSVASLAMRRYFLFRFCGAASPKDQQTVLTYRVRPVLPICVVWFMFLLTAIKGLMNVLFADGSILFAVACVAVTGFLYVWICAEGKTCIERFEREISQDIENRGECS